MYRGMNAAACASAVFNSLRSASRSVRLAVLELTSLESAGGLNSSDNLSMATLVSFAARVAIAARPCVSPGAIICLNLPRSATKYAPTERITKKTNKNAKAIRTRHFAFCSTDVFTTLPQQAAFFILSTLRCQRHAPVRDVPAGADLPPIIIVGMHPRIGSDLTRC